MLSISLLTLSLVLNQTPNFTEGKQKLDGFFDLYVDEADGSVYLAIDKFETPFLFINSMATGLGSNDIGLDRGQLGDTRLVYFHRVGKRVLLIQENQQYRAYSQNPDEQRAVQESFAYSTIWGTELAAETKDVVYVKLDSLVFDDHHGVTRRLENSKEGRYTIDSSRSHYYFPRTKAFPDNSEVEVALTFTGTPKGQFVPDVTPSPDAITLRFHYSFVRLPDNNYKPRAFHPRIASFNMIRRDYAGALNEDLDRGYVLRHRLEKKDPTAAKSEPVKPIIYYVDPGAPKEIAEALISGASWWNQAFEAAGFINAFRVEMLPSDADPMDVRYNVIQWVHRATRGWSYGTSAIDPRTGEIIKGHVTLGSLRVRQDRLLFEGMAPYSCGVEEHGALKWNTVDLSLARIRQLSAHEVGHTLGLMHNFASSAFDRASVMDYPAPLVKLVDGKIDLSEAYKEGIGSYDKLAIHYLYGVFKDEQAGLAALIEETDKPENLYISDGHSRFQGNMHPLGNLWDNGSDPVAELERVIGLRRHLLDNFDTHNMRHDHVLSRLEETLVPVYLHHRFQIEAAVKSVAGASFDYGMNDGDSHYQPVPPETQKKALDLLLNTLDPAFLDLPKHLLNLIPPRAYGYPAHRELFEKRTGPSFDDLGLAETSVQLTLDVLLETTRLNRLINQHAVDANQMSFSYTLNSLLKRTLKAPEETGRSGVLHRLTGVQGFDHLLKLTGDTQLRGEARAQVYSALQDLKSHFDQAKPADPAYVPYYRWLSERVSQMKADHSHFMPTKDLKVPPGSPIGN